MTDPKTRVQRNGRSTSWDAALSLTNERTAVLYYRIRGILQAGGPMTDEELLRWLQTEHAPDKFSASGVRSRRNELVMTGWVTELRDEGGAVVKRPLASGHPGIVWRAALEGEEAPTGSAEPTKAERAHAAGMEAARRWALWNVGDPEHADKIVRAYLDPETVMAELDADGADR